ncbi:flavodoxin [Ruminococcus sp. YE282]|jgi:flavodoxin short chain|uniref:flavodoxin n=1 Tax=Ruminococcus sp. YE282 TaxID=3158780 RepID=UPI000880D63F|nr:flavodoxin [Ruminococcus bromii]SCX82201.1 flavodoxin, short chain [Ruminococcus bromii]HCB95156.1 flavodoxin [Ruminococcus sp.]
MSKVAVVYWSGTGNTEAMANAVAEGAKENGAEVSVLTSAEFDSSQVDNYDAIAFGCPAMGAEELEDSEFLPMFEDCEPKLKDKKIALFGSYGWGDGEWMRTWEESCTSDGAVLATESVICNDAPDDDAITSCKALGTSLV